MRNLKNDKTLVVLMLVVLGVLVGSYLHLLPLTIQSQQNAVYVGESATWSFTTSKTKFLQSHACAINPNGDTSLIQQLRILDQATRETIYEPQPRYGYPNCAQYMFDWPDWTWVPPSAGSFILQEKVKDTYDSKLIDYSEFAFIAQPSTTTECTPGQQICDDSYNPDRILECSADGHYTVWGETCLAGCAVDGVSCAQVCTPGTYTCNGEAQYQYCSSDGLGYDAAQICPYTYPLPTRCVEGQPNPCIQASPTCGDGICSNGETATSCSSDCGTGGPVCGDGTCDAGESANTCRADCDVCWNTDPSAMDLETLCGCFPSASQCASPSAGDQLADFLDKLFPEMSALMKQVMTIMLLAIAGYALYKAMSKGRRKR